MSRSTILLLLFALLIVGGAFLLAGIKTEVAPVRVEKAMMNEAEAK
jgi:hypothetical protein